MVMAHITHHPLFARAKRVFEIHQVLFKMKNIIGKLFIFVKTGCANPLNKLDQTFTLKSSRWVFTLVTY